MVQKYDIKRELASLYAPSAHAFSIVEVRPLNCLAVDGSGDPNTTPAYAQAVEALFSVAYAVKFASKRMLDRDFVVAPLEGLWRADDPASFAARDKQQWNWTMLIVQPDWITADQVAAAIDAVAAKKPTPAQKALPALPLVRFMTLDESTSIQILHVGSYDDEAPVLHELHHTFMPQHGLTFNGDHHEIYLSDPRRVAPAKLKTILRQPVKPA